MYHKVSEEFIERLNKRDERMVKEQNDTFNDCLGFKPKD